MKENLPQRKNIRISNYDYSNTGIYFITICIKNREKILSKIEKEKIVLYQYGKIVEKYIKNKIEDRNLAYICEDDWGTYSCSRSEYEYMVEGPSNGLDTGAIVAIVICSIIALIFIICIIKSCCNKCK